MTRIDPKSFQRHPGLRFRPSPLAHGIAMVIASSLAAQASAENRILEEVVVTATKRSESVQDVPLAITALTGDFVRDVNLNDVKDLVSFTPGVSGNSQDSFIDAISVRGVRTQDFGVGGDPSAAFFKNDLLLFTSSGFEQIKDFWSDYEIYPIRGNSVYPIGRLFVYWPGTR